MILRLTCVALFFAATAASAQETATPSPPVANGGPVPASQKIICHHEASTGSRLQERKICHTRAEWDRIADQSRREYLSNSRDVAGRRE